MEDMRILLAQSVIYLLSVVTEKMMSKEEKVSTIDVWNKQAGIRLHSLALMHSAYYTFNGFKEAINHEKD